MSALSPGAAVSNRSTPEEGVHGRMHYAAAGGTYAAHEHRRHAHAHAQPGDAWIPMVSADRPWIPKFYSIRNVDTTVL